MALSRFVRTGQDFALVDFPDHYNVGDSACAERAAWSSIKRL